MTWLWMIYYESNVIFLTCLGFTVWLWSERHGLRCKLELIHIITLAVDTYSAVTSNKATIHKMVPLDEIMSVSIQHPVH